MAERVLVCSACGRKSWELDGAGERCGLAQPNTSIGCPGTMVDTLDLAAEGERRDYVLRGETGRVEMLVAGECECGWRCACLEGALWPKCPGCGEQVLPPPPPDPPSPGDHGNRLAYGAILLGEGDAVRLVQIMREAGL